MSEGLGGCRGGGPGPFAAGSCRRVVVVVLPTKLEVLRLAGHREPVDVDHVDCVLCSASDLLEFRGVVELRAKV